MWRPASCYESLGVVRRVGGDRSGGQRRVGGFEALLGESVLVSVFGDLHMFVLTVA
jgi:hypothetical protein